MENDQHLIPEQATTAIAKVVTDTGCPGQRDLPGEAFAIFLTERDLAKRWHLSLRTLQRWRAETGGPGFCRIGHAIRYRLSDVLAYEAAVHQDGSVSE